MKSCSYLLIAMLFITAAAPAHGGRRYALIVGVKTYRPGQPLPELAYTENDATGLAAVLKDGGYDVTLMTQAVGRIPGKEVLNPLSDYIRDQLSAMVDNPFLKDDDMVLVALVGHGVQYELVEDDGRKTPKFYFCPADADVARLKTANDVSERNRVLDLGELYTALSNCKAGGRLLLVDACRNDPTKPGLTRALASATLPPLPPPPGGTAAYFSCSAHQQAFEDNDLEHGVFLHYVTRGLRGDADSSTATRGADGQISLMELSEYVSTETYDFVRKKNQGAKQAPELKGEFRVSLPLIAIARSSPAPRPVPTPPMPFTGKLEGEKAGEVREFAGELKIKFCWCPPGEFTMGSPPDEPGRTDGYELTSQANRENQVKVELTKGFWLGQTEVTQELWQQVMGTTPWKMEDRPSAKTGPRFPATDVYSQHAAQFCVRLTERERQAGRLPANWSYALPTEAQWEYACRAGSRTAYGFGNADRELPEYGWFKENSGGSDGGPREVGQKRPNAWNLYDLHGNVQEFCRDRFTEALPGGKDPVVTLANGGRHAVLRGGSWMFGPTSCRSAHRNDEGGYIDWGTIGLRVALVPD